MGKRKIEIETIEDKQKKNVTFSKRRQGLFHKASELGDLCNVQTAVVVFSPAGKPFPFVSHASSVDVVVQHYLKNTGNGGDFSDAVGVVCEAEETESAKEDGRFWWKTVDVDKNCSMGDLLSLKNRLKRLRENVCFRLNDLSASTPSE